MATIGQSTQELDDTWKLIESRFVPSELPQNGVAYSPELRADWLAEELLDPV